MRKLVPIMEDLIADERFAGHQYLSFELRERDGFRMFGPANGSLWWQINQKCVGSDRVLLGLVTHFRTLTSANRSTGERCG